MCGTYHKEAGGVIQLTGVLVQCGSSYLMLFLKRQRHPNMS